MLEQLQKEYAELAATEKVITKKKELVKAQIEELLGDKEQTIPTAYGVFKMIPYSTWTYSEKLSTDAEDLKIRMVDEQESGTATKEVVHKLRFNANKE